MIGESGRFFPLFLLFIFIFNKFAELTHLIRHEEIIIVFFIGSSFYGQLHQ